MNTNQTPDLRKWDELTEEERSGILREDPRHGGSHMWENLDNSGTIQSLLKRPDTYILRHMEHGNIFNIDPKIYAVYADDVNRLVYRKPHHDVRTRRHGITRSELGKCMKNFCPDCIEQVGDVRLTKGAYLPIEHDCPRIRVYDLRGTLLEVI